MYLVYNACRQSQIPVREVKRIENVTFTCGFFHRGSAGFQNKSKEAVYGTVVVLAILAEV